MHILDLWHIADAWPAYQQTLKQWLVMVFRFRHESHARWFCGVFASRAPQFEKVDFAVATQLLRNPLGNVFVDLQQCM